MIQIVTLLTLLERSFQKVFLFEPFSKRYEDNLFCPCHFVTSRILFNLSCVMIHCQKETTAHNCG